MIRAALALLAALGPASAGVLAGDVYVYAGTLLAQAGSPTQEHQTIVITDGRIAEIRAGYAVVPEGVRLIDLSSSFVMPGLIDLHVHLTMEPTPREFSSLVEDSDADLALIAAANARLTLAAGITTVVDLGRPGTPAHESAIFALRDAIAAGHVPGPRILATGTPISVTGQERQPRLRSEIEPLVNSLAVCDGPDDCRRATRRQVHNGADVISFYDSASLLFPGQAGLPMTEEEMRAVTETAHGLGRKVIADGHHASGVAAAIEAGVDAVDSVHLYEERTFDLVREADIYLQSHIYAVVAAVGDTPETLDQGITWWHPRPVLERLFEIKNRPFAVIEAYRNGIRKIAFASDAGNFPHGQNARDLVEFAARGIPAGEVLAIATIHPARLLGLDHEIGALTPGKRADLIALGGNPLSDTSALLDVRLVMHDGRVPDPPRLRRDSTAKAWRE
ncbi:MAG TPA: amidohydrolase family protein [Xanthomonadales bacterium]|nr:amidohydrolase family protein [Xanthomonadales bacterium]